MLPCVLSLAAALLSGLLDVRGLSILLGFAGVCFIARRAASTAVSVLAHVVMFTVCAALFLHVLPGFDNPRVVSEAVLGPGSMPYTKYLNIDKGMAGLFLLGVYASGGTATDEGLRHVPAFLWRFVVFVTVVLVLSLGAGYVRWDPKLPSWWLMWLWSMVFLTALPEEALFRGIAQTGIERWFGRHRMATGAAIVIAGLLFGIAHLGGGWTYVVLASAAGVGYGWIYASTHSIGAAILAHAGLNTVHFLLFSYPALTRAG